MKKIKVNGELALLVALIFLAFGIVLVIKADYGMTVVQAPVFVLSLALPSLTMGTWNYIVQGLLFVLMLMIIRKFRLSFLISFLSGIVYGLILDLFKYLMRGMIADSTLSRIAYFIVGFIFICLAVALFFTCRAPLMPYDIFIREVAIHKKMSIPTFKWIFDISCIVVAIALGLILEGRIMGIGIGTIIFTLLVSPIIRQIMKLLNERFEFVSLFK